MSILVTLSTYDGIVIGSDSRVTYANGEINDSAKKIFLTKNNIAIGLTKDYFKNGIDTETILKDIVIKELDRRNFDIHETANNIKELWCNSSVLKCFRNYIVVAGYDASNVETIYNMEANYTRNGTVRSLFYTGYKSLFSSPSDTVTNYMNDQFVKNCNWNALAFIGVNKGISLCEEWIKEAADLDTTIGGETDIVVIRPNGLLLKS